ncbi:pyruvate dehydrogenase complex dihydrolipoamide acetyltransferase [Komagataeibacter rhaeticus]|uniref:Acetyltransferase component of pyruvate dehydrogenase complex n=2 Tax=Komagataeibacter rhaeticus TaxID=215221 RepID=A0A181CBQ5_9PROT|nr:pyruvate dehydrogenase complex dihydrolipoamide acetyltransferase [Komagataeibacter rhaeticus]ATU72418.1 pyruvate dehydrogenase complex dihydrolipoamide acetyltransferase [Komagataeibacter xylinus]QIP35671.1 pyruvate dehydrogenase complex dihydrolipoamide acetyltransferase [Komagataeibacter rhaeticus]QOC45428.1 pyruvate dehydrogenase complex dihydrolipoamide acetyltransferase [Komagataeibacter rhaeticus]WPP22161.1 pyruvate dehydrogenase complex dihydrolipoamide acetyltransferase [Komagataeib
MPINILMPALSPTMKEGTLARWLKAEGDAIAAGDVIAEIETDKATMEVEAVDEGILGRILIGEGTEGIAVNTPIAILVAEGESVPDAPAATAAATPAPAAPAPATPVAPVPATTQAAPAAPVAPAPKGTRVFASPLARRIAAQKGIDLATLKGSGPNGRIVRRDVEQAQQAPAAAPAATAAPAAAPASAPAPASTAYDTVPHSGMRKVIARRLTEAKSTIPHFYVEMDVELDALLALRSQLNAAAPSEGPGAYKISVNDMLVKAAAVTLRRVPQVNVSYTDDALLAYHDVDISVAVSIPDGLITPIVRAADTKGLRQISLETRDLVARARAGKLKPEEFQGGTFSISNMGMYGVKAFSAIINPPQAAILAIAAGERRAVVKGNDIVIATVMTVTLSVDHRVVDGALAAQWLSAFRTVVENPMSLVV